MSKPSIETGFPALQSQLRRLLPGLMVAFTVGFAASFLGEHQGAPSLLFALLLGLSLGFIYEDKRSAEGIDFVPELSCDLLLPYWVLELP